MNFLFCFLVCGVVCISAMHVDNSEYEVESQLAEFEDLYDNEEVTAS